MSRKSQNLLLRRNVYSFRVRVPDDLRPLVGKKEIKKSLKTGDLKEAQPLARFERVKLDAEWAELRRQLDLKRVDHLSERDIWYFVSKWFVAEMRKNAQSVDTYDDPDDALYDFSMSTTEHYAGTVVYAETQKLLKQQGIDLDPASTSMRHLQRMLYAAYIETETRNYRKHFPASPFGLDPQFADLSANTDLKPVSKYDLKQLLRDYQNDPAQPPVAGKTVKKREAHWQVIKEFFGEDTPIDRIDRQKVREFMTLLEKLPSNASKHFPETTIFQAVELGALKNLPVLSIGTKNDYMRRLGSLFRFALSEGIITSDPTSSLLFRGEKVRADDKRHPFAVEDLNKIFKAPLYVGCINDERGYSKSGPNVIRRNRFWIPLISLFSGMRLNEICQLTLDDFVVEDGVDIILIRSDNDGETKRVKTAAGQRFIPIHPELRRIGLLDYVNKRRQKSPATDALFPELGLASTGYRSDLFSIM